MRSLRTRYVASIVLGIACIITIASTNLASVSRHASPAAMDGIVAIGASATAPLLRTVRVGLNPYLLAVDAAANLVVVVKLGPISNPYVFSGPSSVSMLSIKTGAMVRTTTMRPGVVRAVAIAPRTGHVLAFYGRSDPNGTGYGIGPGHESILDAATGRIIQTRILPTQVNSAVVADRTGRVFAVSGEGVYVLDAATGALLKTIRTRGMYLAVDDHTNQVFLANAFELCMDSGDGCLASLDATTGTPLMNVSLDKTIYAVAVDQRTGLVIIDQSVDHGGKSWVSLVDPRSGNVLNTQPFLGGLDSTIAVDQTTGRAFIVTTPGGYQATEGGGPCTVSLVDTNNGRVLNTTTVATSGGPLSAAVAEDEAIHRLFVVTQVEQIVPGSHYPYGDVPVGNGLMSVFDTHNGHLLRTIPVDRGPHAIVVDQQHGRVFVANEADGTVSVFDATRL